MDIRLTINPEGETSILPVRWPGSDNLVRTGVIADGSCIFHAILSSYSNKYLKMSSGEKSEYIKRLRASLPELITRDIWMRMGQGEVSRIGFFDRFRQFTHLAYKYIQDEQPVATGDDTADAEDDAPIRYMGPITAYIDANRAVCKFIANNMPFKDLDMEIVGHHKRGKDVYFESTNIVKRIKKHFKNKFGANLNEHDAIRFDRIVALLVELFESICKAAIDLAYDTCKSQLSDPSHWIGIEHIELISNIFSVNIYFIDSDTMMPYVFADDRMFPHKKSIIVLWIDKSHFEIVGVIEDDCIRRTFSSDEPLIKTIHAYTNTPQSVQ